MIPSRRVFLKIIGSSILFPSIAAAMGTKPESATRPNIIFIMSDDHSVEAVSCYGSKLLDTPNIDRLAKNGMRFTNCFNVNSLCAPSRAALLTGKHSVSNGFFRNQDKFDTSHMTFPRLLQEAGYETAIVGKWHLRTEPQGFDYYKVMPGHGRFFDCPLKEKGKPWQDGNKGAPVHPGYLTDVITDISIEWIEKQNRRKPFCLMVHHKAPHTEHAYPEKYSEILKDTNLPHPANFDDEYKGKNPGLKNGTCGYSKLINIIPAHIRAKAPAKIGAEEYKLWAYQAFFKGYLRLVAGLDENIGRLLDHLDSSGLSENTVIVYTSDNGFFIGHHGLFNKMWMYDESLRLPLIVSYPKEIKAGSVNDNLVSILDFASTFLDYAQSPLPDELQGMSIRPLLKGSKPRNWRKSLFYQYHQQYQVPGHYGIRTKDFKLINFEIIDKGPFWEFYDLAADPEEMVNQYDNPKYEKIITELKKELNRKKQSLPKYNT